MFADNPWWIGKEVSPPPRLIPLRDTPGVQRFWIPVGGVESESLKALCYGWSKRWGQYSALFLDLSRVEFPPDAFETALDFYTSRLHGASERHLLVVNAAQWIKEDVLREFIDDSYTVLLVYNVKPERDFRAYLTYYPDTPSPGEVKEAFWEGDVERALSVLRGYGKALLRRLRAYFWRHVIAFPPERRFYAMLRGMYSLMHEFYDIREKSLFKNVLSHVARSAKGRFKYRETAETLSLRFETLRSFMDQMLSVGMIYELLHVNRESPRSPRIVLLGNGHFHHLLNHTDPKDILMIDENSDDVLPFVLSFAISRGVERGVDITFEDDTGKKLVFRKGTKAFGYSIGETGSYLELVGVL